MALSLTDSTIVLVGRGSGIARAIAMAAADAGARVVVAGRHPDQLRDAYPDDRFTVERVDLTDEESIKTLAGRVGVIDHLVSTASSRARGALRELDPDAIQLSFDTKVIGPVLLAKHFVDRFKPGGSFTFFSGVAAFKPAIGYLGVAITNGAADFLCRSLCTRNGSGAGQRNLTGRHRYRNLGCARRRGKGGLLRTLPNAQSRAPHRNCR
jgi:NAD(P)-dependent dehydrogenase (short-subunit alcohol dehydrogenase family)